MNAALIRLSQNGIKRQDSVRTDINICDPSNKFPSFHGTSTLRE